MPVQREVDVEATPEEVWEAIATEEGRERWLEEPDREISVELEEEPRRLVWTWSEAEGEPPSRVEFQIVALPAGSRVIVTESEPALELSMLASSMCLVAA
jgi:uncharacterized protein YndB with AHSA1/START domain